MRTKKRTFEDVILQIAKAENLTVKKNNENYSFYRKSGGWSGAVDEASLDKQGIIKNYHFDYSKKNGWSVLPIED